MRLTPWAAEHLQKHSTWKIHSVYRRTVNLQVEDRILALHPETIPMTPLSLALPMTEDSFAHVVKAAEEVSEVRVMEDTLLVGGHEFFIGDRELWDPLLPVGIPLEETDLLSQQVERCLLFYGRDYEGMADSAIRPEPRPEDSPVTALLRKKTADFLSCPISDMELLIGHAKGMVGLGHGLTPSGDDFLTGVLMGFSSMQTEWEKEREQFIEGITPAFEKTNDISRQYLWRAAMGEGGLLWQKLLRDRDCLEYMREDLRQIRNIGHSSGMDTLNGLAAALRLLKKSKREETT